jgi:hypothetical protein
MSKMPPQRILPPDQFFKLFRSYHVIEVIIMQNYKINLLIAL